MPKSPKYESTEELEQLIEEYFKKCEPDYLKDEDGQYVFNNKGDLINVNKELPTITGLALHLGFESRQSIYDYEKRDAYSYTIKRARLRIEHSYEQDIRNPNLSSTGSIFALKNFGWKDKTEVENSGSQELKIVREIVKSKR